MEKTKNNKVYKILLLGDSSVGKTCIILMYTKGKINKNHITTIGLDYATKKEELKDGTIVMLQIWDTAGQERYHSITNKLYKTSEGLILVYDITSLTSFQNINHWLETIKNQNDDNIQIILVGNKKDLEKERQVSYNDGKTLAECYKIDFFEVSALNNDGITNIFQQIAIKLSGIKNNCNNSIMLDRNSHTRESIRENKKSCCLSKSSNSDNKKKNSDK